MIAGHGNKKRKSLLGQVSLEVSIALIGVFILGLASVKICSWFSGQLAFRQESYESTRTTGTNYDDVGYPALSIFTGN